jgi:hypothetical protein
MKTSQSAYFNNDGWTTFHFLNDGSPTTASVLESNNAHDLDGGYGLMTFYESRGYSVSTMFNQLIYGYDGNTLGFTWQQYKEQIDRGNPIMFHLAGSSGGHTVTALGYDDSGQIIYFHDTWDNDVHTMTWGGSYAGYDHMLAIVIELDLPPSCSTQTHHMITVDGALADWCRDTEQLEVDTRPANPVPGNQELLFSWDASSFYVGWGGANPDYGPDLWVYFYSRDSQGTTNSVGGAHTLPFGSFGDGADHALLVSRANPLTYTFYDWTGSWSPDLSFTGAISVTGDQTEARIPRVELGISGAETLALLAFAEGEGSDISWASFPTANPTGTAFGHVYKWPATAAGTSPNDYHIVSYRRIHLPIVVR